MSLLSVVKNVPKLVKKTGGKVLFKLSKNKPQLLVGTGAAIAVGGFVWAIISATKVNDVMAEGEKTVNDIQEKIDEESDSTALTTLNKDLRKAKCDNIFKMATLMGVPCLVFAGGMAMMVGGHIILVRRFGQVSASLAAIQRAFAKYRAMNIAEHGEECDRCYRYGIVGETEAETTITDENGKETTVKCKVPIVDEDHASIYRFMFSEETSFKCPKDPIRTISFLKSQESYWNMWMETKQKPVTLNMVLEDLGIELDPDDPMNDYILIAGWRPNGDGDRKIDFGIMRAINKPAFDLSENVVFLEFNCDGNIYHSTRYTKDGKKVC